MTFKNAILLAMSMTLVSGQRPSFAGSRPIGFPEIIKTTTEGLGNRFGEDDVSTTTVKLPLEANGDRDLVDRLSKLPVDQQPFWFINWQALEEHRKNPQTFEQKPNPFIENTAPVSNQQSSQQFSQQQFQQPQRPNNQQFQQPQRPNNQQFQQPQRPSTQQFQQPQRPSSQQFSQQQRPPQQQQQMSFEQQLQSMQQQQQALQQQQQSLQQQMQAFQQAQQQFSQERQKFMELQQAFMQQQNQQTGNSNTKNKPRSPNFD